MTQQSQYALVFLPRSAMLEHESARRTLVMRQTISFTVKKQANMPVIFLFTRSAYVMQVNDFI